MNKRNVLGINLRVLESNCNMVNKLSRELFFEEEAVPTTTDEESEEITRRLLLWANINEKAEDMLTIAQDMKVLLGMLPKV